MNSIKYVKKYFKNDLNKLSKNTLLTIIEANEKDLKDTIIQKIIDNVNNNINKELILKQVYVDNALSIGLKPIELEEYISCSKTERLRWQKEGKIKIAGYDSFYKYGKNIEVIRRFS